MDIKREIEKIAEDALSIYRITSKYFFVLDNEEDSKLTSQYKGREIYELLQNIDDAAAESKDCIASIILDGDYLTVSNYGNPFTLETLQRLCQGKVSNKTSKFIGCKGIGFRSVLNWADEIDIYSGSGDGYISVRFSPGIAKERLNELLNSDDRLVNDHIQRQIEELTSKGFSGSYPILQAPSYIDPIDKEYDTVIRLKVKNDLKADIVKDLENIERYRNILLFLPNLKKIDFQIIDKKISFSKSDKNGIVTLSIDDNGTASSQDYICRHCERKLKKKYEDSDIIKLGVAIPTDELQFTAGNPRLYTFFPVEDLACPFPALLHATFFLTDNRNDLKLDSDVTKAVNKEVFEHLLKFYIETVVETTQGERRLKLLVPSGRDKIIHDGFIFNDNLGKLEEEGFFFDECSKSKVFYTVEDKYKTGVENEPPIVLDSFPENDCFAFSRLVRHIDNERTRSFAKHIIKVESDIEGYLHDSINLVSDTWNSSERISTFYWWNSQKYTRLPKLLKTLDGKFLETKEVPCFLSEDTPHEWVKNIPSWATISILNTDDQAVLIQAYKDEIDKNKKSGEADKRVLPRLINHDLVEIMEQSSRQVVISPINASVGNDFERGKDFILWLWGVWNFAPFDETIKTKTRFVVPTENHEIRPANEVFISKFKSQNTLHSNELGNKIFRKQGNYANLLEIDFGDAPKERVEAFLKDLGVSKHPRLEPIITNDVHHGDKSLQKKFIEYVLSSHPMENEDAVNHYDVCLQSINNIENILENVDTKDIIKWIFNDPELKNAIINDIQPKDCYIQYRLYRKQYNWQHNNEWRLPSFIRFVFSKTEWIKINGKSYSPEQLIITNKSYLNDYGLNCISEHDIDVLAGDSCSKEELQKLLNILGAKNSYLDLSSKEFYGLLLALPATNNESAQKISRELYRAIIDNSQNLKQFADCDNKTQFMKEGKVLVKKADGSAFEDIANAFFSSYAVIKPDNRYPIDVPTRRGKKEDFKTILGVDSYELVYSVKSKIVADCNITFQKDLESFIPCIMAYRRGKKEDVCNLAIELVKEATIIYEDKEKKYTSGYTLLKSANRHWIICVGDERDYTHLDKSLIADALVQIFNVLFNFPSKDFLNKVEQLFIYSHRQREHFIEDEFGSADEIEISKKEILESKEFYSKIADFFDREDESGIMSINWNNPSTSDLAEIVKLLKACGKSLSNLNDILERTISIESYNRSALMREYETDKTMVRSDIYSSLQDHKQLISTWNCFERKIMQYNGDLANMDFACKDVYKRIKEIFYNEYSITESSERVDLESIYKYNVGILKPLFMNKEVSLNDFLKDIEKDSLLYYKGDENLYKSAEEFISTEEEKIRRERTVDNNSVNNLALLLNQTTIGAELTDGKYKYKGGKGVTGRGGVSTAATERTGRQNKKQGNTAEYLTVMKLAKKEVKEVNEFFGDQGYSIHWVSGAAKDIQTAEGQDMPYSCSETNDACGYDIRLESEDGSKKMYIEVKSSSTDNCSFYMSANELEKAIEINGKNEGEQYRIIFVSSLNVNDPNSHPCITFIDAKIEDGFEYHALQYNVVYRNQK